MRKKINGAPKFLVASEYAVVGSAFVFKLLKMKCEVFILACGCTHLHVLYQSRSHDAQTELGRPKQYASYKLRHPSGKLWAAGASIVRIRNPGHADRALQYISDHGRREGAWIWRMDCDPPPTRETVDAFIRTAQRRT